MPEKKIYKSCHVHFSCIIQLFLIQDMNVRINNVENQEPEPNMMKHSKKRFDFLCVIYYETSFTE